MRGALLIIVVLVGVVFFTNAGNWLMTRLSALPEACYAGMIRLGTSRGGPLCDALARGIAGMDGAMENVESQIAAMKERVGLGTGVQDIDDITARLRDSITGISRSRSELASVMSGGPSSLGKVGDQFRQAVDGFTIGQLYMKDAPVQALPWLQQSAAQPQGYGVLSQLTLGNMYAQGAQGVPANPALATTYLAQAKESLAVLAQSDSPQSRQMLSALPGTPSNIEAQINQAIRQLRAKR